MIVTLTNEAPTSRMLTGEFNPSIRLRTQTNVTHPVVYGSETGSGLVVTSVVVSSPEFASSASVATLLVNFASHTP